MFSIKLNTHQPDNKQIRSEISQLIINVLCGYISVKDALLKFPKDTEDKSIIASWHALSHYEADEDLRSKDILYKQEQDEYLEFIAFALRDNKDLPLNIIEAYSQYYKDVPIADNTTWTGKFRKFIRFLNID